VGHWLLEGSDNTAEGDGGGGGGQGRRGGNTRRAGWRQAESGSSASFYLESLGQRYCPNDATMARGATHPFAPAQAVGSVRVVATATRSASNGSLSGVDDASRRSCAAMAVMRKVEAALRRPTHAELFAWFRDVEMPVAKVLAGKPLHTLFKYYVVVERSPVDSRQTGAQTVLLTARMCFCVAARVLGMELAGFGVDTDLSKVLHARTKGLMKAFESRVRLEVDVVAVSVVAKGGSSRASKEQFSLGRAVNSRRDGDASHTPRPIMC